MMNKFADLLERKRKAKREAEDVEQQKSVKQARSDASETEIETKEVWPYIICYRRMSIVHVGL